MPTNPKALKHGLGNPAIRRIARNIKAVEPAFSDQAFIRAATKDLQSLELKARVKHIAGALKISPT
ncbi:MAG: hypothetical protein R3C68_19200 [Myxococcota bacterium]